MNVTSEAIDAACSLASRVLHPINCLSVFDGFALHHTVAEYVEEIADCTAEWSPHYRAVVDFIEIATADQPWGFDWRFPRVAGENLVLDSPADCRSVHDWAFRIPFVVESRIQRFGDEEIERIARTLRDVPAHECLGRLEHESLTAKRFLLLSAGQAKPAPRKSAIKRKRKDVGYNEADYQDVKAIVVHRRDIGQRDIQKSLRTSDREAGMNGQTLVTILNRLREEGVYGVPKKNGKQPGGDVSP